VVCFLSLAVLPLLGSTVHAQDVDETLYRDLSLTVQARKLLLDDAQLTALNLGVKVSNRIAVLWGPVPSRELSLRAEQRLRGMFQLIEIRNGMTVEGDDDARPLAPEQPRFLPDPFPPAAPREPRRPQLESATGIALAGIVTPEETLTVRSSPLSGLGQFTIGSTTLRVPFLGSFVLPR
jgi:hypothetical protein